MGTDLFTSSRGPGVIGTFMALFVLIGFGVLYILVFDESLQGGEQTIESVISTEAKTLDSLKSRIAASQERMKEAETFRKTVGLIEEESIRVGLLEKRHANLKAAAASARELVSATENDWESYKQAYRSSERSAAEGEKMEQLTTLSGTTYEKVKITDIDAVRMQIRHSNGITGIPFEELPADLQDRFQFDNKEKEIRVAKEDLSRKQGHTGSRVGDLKIAIADLKLELNDSRKKVATLEKAVANAKAAVPSLEGQLRTKQSELAADLQQRSNRTSTGRQGISRAPQIREQIDAIEGKIALASRLIPRHSSEISKELERIREREDQLQILEENLGLLRQKMKDARVDEKAP